jgi:flagellar motility protein MotE (MotC chaperone)
MAEKKHSQLEKIFYLVILPLLFTVILMMVLLSFLGVPVWKTLHQWGSHIPSAISGTTAKQSQTAQRSDQTKSQDQQTFKIQQTANQKEAATLRMENEELQKQLDEKQVQKNKDEMQQVADLYANMSASKAAAILENLPLDEAAFTISALDEDQQGNILGSFSDPKKAAQISTLRKEIILNQDEDPVVLKKHIHDLAQKQK